MSPPCTFESISEELALTTLPPAWSIFPREEERNGRDPKRADSMLRIVGRSSKTRPAESNPHIRVGSDRRRGRVHAAQVSPRFWKAKLLREALGVRVPFNITTMAQSDPPDFTI